MRLVVLDPFLMSPDLVFKLIDEGIYGRVHVLGIFLRLYRYSVGGHSGVGYVPYLLYRKDPMDFYGLEKVFVQALRLFFGVFPESFRRFHVSECNIDLHVPTSGLLIMIALPVAASKT